MRLLVLIPALLSLFLLGCIEGEEEVWLERDGSGRLEATYRMPSIVFEQIGDPEEIVQSFRDAATRDPHVDLTTVSCPVEDGDVVLKIAGTFDDLHKLATFPQRQLRDPTKPDERAKTEALFGKIKLDTGFRGISYDRTIDIAWLLTGPYEKYKRAPGILDDSTLRIILNLPAPTTETNATTRSADNQRLEWTFLLKEHVTKPMQLTARVSYPLPSFFWFLGVTPIVLLTISFLVRNKRSLSDLESSLPK